MDENVIPSENLPSQNVHVKAGPQATDSIIRSPFKELGNNALATRANGPTPKSIATPSKYNVISELDEERTWRERTEVVTAIDHNAYEGYAKEMITDVINQIPSANNRSTVVDNKLLHPTVAEFRGSPVAALVGDSDSEYESAGELDDTAIEQIIPSPVVPKANSTLLDASSSANNTLNRSDVGNLLNSFENMKLNETRDIPEEDNFHDASDSVENTSQNLSPGNNAETVSTSLQTNMHNDTFDQLTASFEKVAVSDTSDMNTPVKSNERPLARVELNKKVEVGDSSNSVVEPNVVISPSSPIPEKVPNDESHLQEGGKAVAEGQLETSPEAIADSSVTGFVKPDEEKDIVPTKGYNLEFLDKLDDPNFDPFSTKAAVTNSPDKEKSEAVADSVMKERQSECLDKSGAIADISEKTELLEVHEAKEENSKEIGQTEATEAVVVPEHTQENGENVSAEEVQQSSTETGEQDQQEEAVVPPQKGYGLDFDKLEDPCFDPFATKTAVSNSPEKGTKEIVAAEPVEFVKPVSVVQEQILLENNDKQEESHAHVNEDPVEDGSLKTETVTENTSEEQEEEIIPPKKEYNMDFFDNIDDPNFNPFSTKTSVSNSPGRKEEPISQVESEPKQKEEEPVKLLDIQEEVKISEDVAPKADVTAAELAKEEVTADQRQADEEMDVFEEKEEDDVPIPPKKEYNLDFLDNLDDPNLNPFATKTAVNNSPDKKDGPGANSKLVEAPPKAKETLIADVIEKDEKVTQIKTLENLVVEDIPTSCVKVENIAKSEMVKSETPEEPSGTQEEDEPILPKKGYNLDFLDNLDDPNFNPFSLKTTVTNSPDKKNGTVAESKTPEEAPKPKEKVEKKPVAKEEKKVTQKTSSAKEKETVKIKTVMPKEDKAEEKLEAQEEDEIIPPKKGYNLEFLDNLEDPNFNPFTTKTTVSGSPDKKNCPAAENKVAAEGAMKPKKVAEKKPVADVKEEGKATQMKKTSENASSAKEKDAPRSKTVGAKKEAESKGTTEVQEEEEIIPPKKGYKLDLDHLDDPNFNPFATKMSVSNSPDKKKEPAVESKKVEENKVSEEVPKPEEEKKQIKETRKPVAMKKRSPVAKAPEEKQDDVAAEPKGVYQLDLDPFEDPNFNPFATKAAVSNSPGKTNVSVGEKEEKNSGTSQEKKTQAEDAKSMKKSIKEDAEKMEVDIVPKKVSHLDFLDNLDDPNFNPFAQKQLYLILQVKGRQQQEKTQVEEKIQDHKDKNIVETQTTGSQITKSEFVSSLGSIDFEQISKEAIRLASEVTPKTPEDQKMSELAQPPRDVFSPLPAKHSSAKQDAFAMDEFTSATEFSGGDQELSEGENFQDATCYPIFNNPEDLDVLGSHGMEGDKINLVRNSLYVKFDPLVSGRQSLAPMLAQQLLGTKEEDDPRRFSGLISFSPSPIKPQRSRDANGTPVRPQTTTRADETLVLDSTALDSTVVGENSNISIMSGGPALNNTVISNAPGESANETVIQAVATEKMVPERVMNERLKNLELSMQDTLLRKIRAFEEEQKKSKQQIEEQNIALASMEEENGTLKATIVKMQEVLAKIMKQEEAKEKERKNQLVLLENQYEAKILALQKESQQYQDELKNAEAPFFDLVKKFERLREVTECLRRNEESLKSENEGIKGKLAQKEETFKNVLQTLEENYAKAQEEFSQEKEKHEKELGKASVMLKRAEVKILSLTSSLEEKIADNQRLAALLDDITNKFG
ncbi:LOW QUALITY PROTEIN: transforming acidic coiled-coil-containing protein 2-like [Penaeus chinensis]|uniref:LOW QUALITY PROTEIN: transforming acidic coiled-coil-containing protein 2-like n=1 Tax=Penaeus chinensis TaxID=139456 RepID=UPI001FB61D83|nr:LOW QUALITY PROTEIN: transforming acidic coiled-coil-containing protein 2-like [Penaeus chinensis]